MDIATEPRIDLARKVLPAPLLRALKHVFAQGISDTMLVGGTALAGFYAGHRRSDDLDLFCATEVAYRGATLAMDSLAELGATFSDAYRSRQFSHVNAELDGHRFTVDVVLDSNVFRVGNARCVDGIYVASLETLLRMKAATMVSRCSEKDLYDLLWILERQQFDLEDLLRLGQSIDGGANDEAVLLSVTTATLNEGACEFGLGGTADRKQIFREVSALKSELEHALSLRLHQQPVPPLRQTVERIRKWRRRR